MKQDVFESLPYVTKRHNKYGIRVRVPEDLRPVVGKLEITKSLRTSDPVVAKRIYHEVLASVQAELDAARNSIKPAEPALLTVDMATGLAEAYFKERFYKSESEAHRVVSNTSLPDDTRHQERKELLAEVGRDLAEARTKGEASARWTVDHILKTAGFPEIAVTSHPARARSNTRMTRSEAHVDKASPGYLHLLRLAFLGEIEVLERMHAILSGQIFDRERSLFPGMVFPDASTPARAVNTAAIPSSKHQTSVAELLERFLAAHPNKSDRWKLDIRTAYRPLAELKGSDTVANTLTRQDFRDVLAFIRRMPRQIGNKKKQWGGMSLQKIVALTEREGGFEDDLLHPKTCNKYIRRIAQIMEWAEHEPLIERNFASGIFIPAEEIDDDDPSREPFEMDQLNRLFQTSVFQNPDPQSPSLYWATLIALFHGMRSEEVLQLTAADFQHDEDDIWFVDIHRRGNNHLKNKTSIRKVPLHPMMETFGLADLVRSAIKRNDKRLFWDVERGAEGRFTPAFSRRYSRYLAKEGIKTDTISFHSLRHNFRDAARNARLSGDAYTGEEITCALGGWTFGSGAQKDYGTGFWMTEKNRAIQEIAYPKVDFDKIKRIRW